MKILKKKTPAKPQNEDNALEGWGDLNYYEEGQLAIDVLETDKEIIIKSTIAGVEAEDIDISISNDMLTIKGERSDSQIEEGEKYLYQECYWGAFSRTVILPAEIEEKKIKASLEKGILTITLPKKKTKPVEVKIK